MYHVSPVASLTKLEPRVPAWIVDEEPDIPRVCAAPTVDQCVTALVDLDVKLNYYVYEIETAPDVDNDGVINWPWSEDYTRWHDAKKTGEVWYLAPVKCELVGTVDFFGKFTRG